jgi:hypothetical protein
MYTPATVCVHEDTHTQVDIARERMSAQVPVMRHLFFLTCFSLCRNSGQLSTSSTCLSHLSHPNARGRPRIRGRDGRLFKQQPVAFHGHQPRQALGRHIIGVSAG